MLSASNMEKSCEWSAAAEQLHTAVAPLPADICILSDCYCRCGCSPRCAGRKLPSAISKISHAGWIYLLHDFKLQVVALKPADLPAIEHAPAIAAHNWEEGREDTQKDMYMAYIRNIFPLDDDTGVCLECVHQPQACVRSYRCCMSQAVRAIKHSMLHC